MFWTGWKNSLCHLQCMVRFTMTVTSVSMNGVGAQGDPCIATILWSIVRPHLLYSASSPAPLTKYSILHNRISSVSLGSSLPKRQNVNWAEATHKGCFRWYVAPPTNRAVNWTAYIIGLLYMAFALFFCAFLMVHISPTRTGDLNSHHQQCCPGDDGIVCDTAITTAMQPSARCLTPWLRWTTALFAILRRYPPPWRGRLGLDIGEVHQINWNT
jgi:hypothetical protein